MLEKQSTRKVSLPDELLLLAEKLDGKSLDEKVQLSLAVNLYLNKHVTLEKAAHLSSQSIVDFMDTLKQQKIPWGEYTWDHKEQDDPVITKMQDELEKQ